MRGIEYLDLEDMLTLVRKLGAGNKRLAWLATVVFLDLNGRPVTEVEALGNVAVDRNDRGAPGSTTSLLKPSRTAVGVNSHLHVAVPGGRPITMYCLSAYDRAKHRSVSR